MNWRHFIAKLKELGYEGDGENLSHVKSWLNRNGHDAEYVDTGDDSVEIKSLFDARPGQKLDMSDAAKKAAEESRINEQVEARIAELKQDYDRGIGVSNKAGGGGFGVKHDVSVTKERWEDSPTGCFKSVGHFLRDVVKQGKTGHFSGELETWTKALSTYSSEGIGADGGFAVPEEMRTRIEQLVAGEDSVMGRCSQINLSGSSVRIPVDDNTVWDNTNGIRTFWEGEAGSITQSKLALEQKELRPRKLACLVPVTDELLEDNSALAQYVGDKAGQKMDFKIGEAIFRGTGLGQPLGMLNSGCLVSVAKQSGQAADTLLAINIAEMWTRMYEPYRQAAVWFIHQDIEPELMRMGFQARNDSGGGIAAASTQNLYTPAGGLSASPYGTLLGRPVIPTQHCETLGDKGDIIFASMPQYLCATKGGITSASSMHLWFDQGVTAFRFTTRVDGQPMLDAAISSRDGTNTMSSFVTLNARA